MKLILNVKDKKQAMLLKQINDSLIKQVADATSESDIEHIVANLANKNLFAYRKLLTKIDKYTDEDVPKYRALKKEILNSYNIFRSSVVKIARYADKYKHNNSIRLDLKRSGEAFNALKKLLQIKGIL